MKEINVVIAGKLSDRLMSKVETAFTAYRLWEQPSQEAFFKEKGNDIQAIVTSGNPVMGASKALIERFPNLKIIASNGVGYDSIDIAAAKARNVIVTNTPQVLNDCVADIGMGLLLDVARGITSADRYVREGRWPVEGRFRMATKVSGKCCGIVGFGNIGSAVARRAAAFNMDIHFYDPSAAHKVTGTATSHESLVSLAQAADFLVLTLPGGEKTRGVINRDVFNALGSKGFLISISRGSVVNEDDLIEALQNQTIAGAGMDVYAHEPHVPEALMAMPNVVLTPHIASGTTETFNAMADLVYDNLAAFFSGKPTLTPVK
ncbi:2-hydroxyacid dehydrogenase [Mangrovibacter sp. MFB070]|uniref:2-hydroxyacid dehydrogenase n=1 Tax=Mangrovibacter sp. MFB070 TaxID=1224318 RepID=UPI000A837354|nr:2-hydroxyacid dehydrogenase [Mangrovibacter sp. MFB070]